MIVEIEVASGVDGVNPKGTSLGSGNSFSSGSTFVSQSALNSRCVHRDQQPKIHKCPGHQASNEMRVAMNPQSLHGH